MLPSLMQAPESSLRNYTKLQRLLLSDLQELLDVPTDNFNTAWLQVVLNALLDSLQAEFELRSRVVTSPTRSVSQAERLNAGREYRRLFAQLLQLQKRAAKPPSDGEGLRQLRQEVRQWLAAARSYREQYDTERPPTKESPGFAFACV
jgi:hypothetical protein